jgi:hypothetical protein
MALFGPGNESCGVTRAHTGFVILARSFIVHTGVGTEPVQGFLAGLTLDATAAPRPLDEAAPATPFCFRLPAGFAAEFVGRETALLRGPISELVTESIGDGRSMADESGPWAVPPASPITPSPLPAP